jgi:hypothetical protein
MRIATLLALLLFPLMAQAAEVDLILLDPQPSVSGGCPAKVHFTGRIRTTGPLDVKYQWLRSDGAKTDHELHVAKASTQNIATD